MWLFRAGILLFAGLLLAACTPTTQEGETALLPGTGVTATVTEHDAGQFTVQFSFEHPQTALFFSRSQDDYRTTSLIPLDDGVRLERINGLDSLLFDTPRQNARFSLTARPDLRYQDYSHFIAFSDGALMLYTGQFELLPMPDRAAIAELDGDLSAHEGEQPVLGVRVRSERGMILEGQRVTGEAIDISSGGGSFLYLGAGDVVETANYVGLLDPALPDWIETRFPSDIADIFAELEAGWGFGLPEPATLLFAFEGYDNPGFSNKGGVLGRQLVIQSSGAELREEDPFIHAYLLWFFAHEAAHLFQNVAGPSLDDPRDSWIHEGGANAMANRIMAGQGEAAADYLRWSWSNAFSNCVATLEAGPLREADRRGQFDGYYACGEFIALISDAALADADYFDIWNAMLVRANARAGDADAHYDLALYRETLAGLGADDAVLADIDRLVTARIDNPQIALREMLEEYALNPQFSENGNLIGLSYPQ